MLDRIQRQYVERIKQAHTIRVVVDGGEFEWKSTLGNIRKLAHDIALAIQDYYVKNDDTRESFQRDRRSGSGRSDAGLEKRLPLRDKSLR